MVKATEIGLAYSLSSGGRRISGIGAVILGTKSLLPNAHRAGNKLSLSVFCGSRPPVLYGIWLTTLEHIVVCVCG